MALVFPPYDNAYPPNDTYGIAQDGCLSFTLPVCLLLATEDE